MRPGNYTRRSHAPVIACLHVKTLCVCLCGAQMTSDPFPEKQSCAPYSVSKATLCRKVASLSLWLTQWVITNIRWEQSDTHRSDLMVGLTSGSKSDDVITVLFGVLSGCLTCPWELPLKLNEIRLERWSTGEIWAVSVYQSKSGLWQTGLTTGWRQTISERLHLVLHSWHQSTGGFSPSD